MSLNSIRKIGFITYAEAIPFHSDQMDTAEARLTSLGYRDGQTALYRRCFGGRDKAQTLRLAEELVRWGADIILSFMTNADLAVLAATKDTRTPIVCWSMDPVDSGLVETAAYPGGHLTGVGFAPGVQWLQLRFLKALKPTLRSVGHLFNPGYAVAPGALRKLREAGQLLNIDVRVYDCREATQLINTVVQMATDGVEALIVGPHELFNSNGALLSQAALSRRLPAIGLDSVVVNDGVAGFTPDFVHIWEAAAVLAHRILLGESPGKIPIARHIKPIFTINLRSLTTLGLVAPEWLLNEADRIIPS